MDIDAFEIPIIPNWEDLNYSKVPKQHGIITYLPEGKEQFYGIEFVKFIAEKHPELKIYIVGNENDSLSLKNVKFLGKLSQEEMLKLYDKTTILLRIPKHDGLSLMLLEALIKGKEVIYCYNFPYTKCATTNEEVDLMLNEIISKPPKLNEEGHQYIIENYNIDVIRKKLQSILLNLLNEKG